LSFAAFKLFQIDLSRNEVFWITLFFHPMLQLFITNTTLVILQFGLQKGWTEKIYKDKEFCLKMLPKLKVLYGAFISTNITETC
jgi:hypothetical protein